MTDAAPIGFIGLGVMGEPMCRNLARKCGRSIIAFDLDPAPVTRLAGDGVAAAAALAEVGRMADIVFLSLPGGKEVEAVVTSALLAHARPGQTIVDLSTSPVALTRELAGQLAARGADYADAPVARTRQAAETGTLSIMVGAKPHVFQRIEPFLSTFASDVTHCGDIGCGQVVKIMNNMIIMENVVALAEAWAIGRRAGVDGKLLFETLTKGSADSFSLRNHGMKAILPDAFPERAFSTEYALKDLSYALELARQNGVPVRGAEVARQLLEEAKAEGYGANYWPIIARIVDAAAR
ncbi:MAG: NAD(P)-dependent oxidoreductase [Hyphomicrobiaceae bacterium]